jgi:hypothetical protein
MATFNMLITYPDTEAARIVAALRSHYTTDGPPPVVPTQAQAIEAFRQSTLAALRDLVLRAERDTAEATALASVVPVNPT